MSATVIYRRQSLAVGDDELAIDRQLKVCEAKAEQRGVVVSEVLTDNSVSASKRGRPAYDRLVKMIEVGAVSQVIILRVDRLLRLNVELEELIALVEKHDLTVITCEGDIDLSTPQGRLIARILVSVARNEMDVKSARHKLANDQRAEAGLPHAGRRAFGYEIDGMTLREDEALALKEIGHKFVDGWSLTQIATWLNDQGYRTTMGNKFYSIALRNMFGRKRYAGIREHDGVEYPAQWPAVWDADLWGRIQYQMRTRHENNGPAPRKYLLTGLIYCGACGCVMNGTTNYDRKTGEPKKAYRCNRERLTPDGEKGCGKVSRGSVPLEWFIRELICYRLDSDELKMMLHSDGRGAGELLNKQQGYKERLDSLLSDYADGTLNKAEYKVARSRVQSQLDVVERELALVHGTDSLEGLIGAGASVRERWELEGEGWRQKLVTQLIERITVNPSRKLPRIDIEGKRYYFDSEAVDVTWKA